MTLESDSVRADRPDVGLVTGLVGDGRSLLSLTGLALWLAGGFALFLSARREFLPHDVAFLGQTAAELCAVADCRVNRFMFHDRVAFGGTLLAIGVVYVWMAAFPLRAGYRWAWHAFVVSGTLGFASFLAYLGYGYLDTWHGAATLALLPCFLAGLWRTRRIGVRGAENLLTGTVTRGVERLARWGLAGTAAGMVLAGLVIVTLGSSVVFVPQDVAFMGMDRAALDAVNPRLVPLIAHDRAGFGGGLLTIGTLVGFIARHASVSRALRQALLVAGTLGFGCAVGVHYVEGYTDFSHLAPAFAGVALFYSSLAGLSIPGSR
ncbi:MAG: hypothetical protein JNL48_08275 [Acidobacteria bacterium]|nr:hypothetical protein [Acidobacteriota bacterium]